MYLTQQLYAKFNCRSINPKKKAFFEVIPLCSKNGIENQPQKLSRTFFDYYF